MRKILLLSSIILIGFLSSGCATWNGVKEDSQDGWEKTKEVSSDAWEKTKEVGSEAWNNTKKAVSGE